MLFVTLPAPTNVVGVCRRIADIHILSGQFALISNPSKTYFYVIISPNLKNKRLITHTPVPPESVYSKKQIQKKLRQSLLHICLFGLFYIVFSLTTPHYIKDPANNGPIDSRVQECKFFDGKYVYDAKHTIYNAQEYFKLFLPLDLVFPVFYTIMFLTILAVFKGKPIYKPARYLVFAGMIFDYLENISFSLYLKSSIEISSLVAFFTTIKTFLVAINILVFIAAFIMALRLVLKKKMSA